MNKNIRQGDGAGATAGFRGGKGKPGYPVPDNLKHGIEVVDEITEDLISKLMSTDFVDKEDDKTLPKQSRNLDLVVGKVISDILGEGGAAISGDRIEKKDVSPTIEKFRSEVLSKIAHRSASPIGSTGKKLSSGDIDIGLDTQLAFDQVESIVDSLGLENKASKGLGVISIKFPQVTGDGSENGKFAQIDLMIGPKEWMEFSYYAPSEEESAYSGVHARALFIAMMNVVAGQSVSPAKGFFKKGDKSKDKQYGQDPNKAVELINAGSSEKWSVSDLNKPFEKIWEKALRSFDKEKLDGIRKYYVDFMKSVKKDVPKELGEAPEKKKGMPKGIQHIEDMNPHDFMSFISKYRDLSFDSKLEVSEKVDGSAALTFGVSGGKIWTQSKNGQKKTESSQYGDKPMFKPLKMAHLALQSKEKQIASVWPKEVDFMTGEILYTKIPNSIEYGPNVVMIHGVHKIGDATVQEEESRKFAEVVTKATGEKLNDGKEDWKFEYKRIIPTEEVIVDVKNEYENLEQVYSRLKELEADKLKKDGKAPYKAAADSFKAIQVAVKKKLLDKLRKQKSVYGPEGGGVEGIVFRDLESGDMTKLVDKEYFTKLNQFLWSFRNLLDKGVKVGDKMELGVMTNFIKGVAQNVIGSNDIATTVFVKKLKSLAGQLDYPEEANTPEKKADYVLSQYIKQNNLMQGDYITSLKQQVQQAKKNFEKAKDEWDSNKSKDLKYDVKDDEGNVIKTVVMDKLIKDRTDTSFEQTSSLLDSLEDGVEKISGLDGDLTKKTALLKLVMGQNRFEKLVGQAEDEEQVSESIEDINPKRAFVRQIEQELGDKLRKRGIDPADANFLGSGTQGTAIHLKDGRVLKITGDSKEAVASLKIMNKDLKNLVKVFDVFRIPSKKMLFGIVTEKLEEIPGTGDKVESATGQALALNTAFRVSGFDQIIRDEMQGRAKWSYFESSYEEMIRTEYMYKPDGFVELALDKARAAVKTLKHFNVDKIVDDVYAAGIAFADYHAGNILKSSSGRYVLNDIGYSNTLDPKQPPMLERLLVTLRENTADTVGVTIGRFQPFHRGHAALIRDLAAKFSRVIVIVAGNKKDKDNPFSFEVRSEMMKKSLPDVISKVEIHKAEFMGKNSGYIPGVLSDIIKNKRSSVEADVAINILIGNDRLAGIKQQMDSARKLKQQGEELFFNPDLATVSALPDVKNDDEAGRVSGTSVREALLNDDKEKVKKLIDSHLVSNSADFEQIYVKLRKELEMNTPKKKSKTTVESIVESVIFEALEDAGGLEAVLDTVKANQKALHDFKGIKFDEKKMLGKPGKDGAAYDVSGNKVLKITTDTKEAKACQSIKGKTLKHVVRIYDVFRFRSGTGSAEGGVYGILEEKLSPLSDSEKKSFNSAIAWLLDEKVYSLIKTKLKAGDWEGVKATARSHVEKIGDKIFEDNQDTTGVIAPLSQDDRTGSIQPPTPQKSSRALTQFDNAMSVLEDFKFKEILNDLRSVRIEYADFHGDNMMKRGSEFVINDLGRAGSAGAEPPMLDKNESKIVESLVESIISEFAAFTGIGDSMIGTKAGSSSVSSFKNQVDPDSEELWQNQLDNLKLKPGHPIEIEESQQDVFGSSKPEDAQQEDDTEKNPNATRLPENTWVKWSDKASAVDFKYKGNKGDAGGGEARLAIELEQRRIKFEIPQKKSERYDLIVSGKQWEVKEYTDIRIESSGAKQVQKTLKFFLSYAEAINGSISEIEKMQLANDVFAENGIPMKDMKSFCETAIDMVKNGNLTAGITGMTKEPKFPNFMSVADTLTKILQSAKTQEKKKVKISVGDGTKEINLLDSELSVTDLVYLSKMLRKVAPDSASLVEDFNVSNIIESNFKENGLGIKDIEKNAIAEMWMETYDPKNIMSHIEKIVLTDNDKGFYILNADDLLKLYGPAQISKYTIKLTPRSKSVANDKPVSKEKPYTKQGSLFDPSSNQPTSDTMRKVAKMNKKTK